MPNGIDILQLNTVTSTSNADKLYVHQNDTLVQVTKSNFMSEINNNIADEYDSTSTYAQGDYCMYNGQLYVCTTTISTSEEWNSSHWTSTTCADGFNANGIPMSEKGSVNGVAELDANGKVPTSQLPSYVDDVLEYSSLSAFPSTGETGKIYIALDTNLTYRWSGTVYVEISPSLALGETSSTAYRGDRGVTAYTHSQTTSGNPHNVTKSDVGLGNVENFKAVSTEANQGLTSTEQSNAKDNLGLSTVATSGSYTDLINIPTVDTALDPTSTNAVQNKAIAHELAGGNTQASGDVVTISDGSNLALTSATTTLTPIQDLHGYSNPWVGGAGKNLFGFEEWLKSKNVTYTKQGNAYTLTANYLVGSSNYWEFSDTPINVTLSATVENGTATNVGFRLKNTVNDEVSTKGTYITMVANAVYIDWSTSGTVTITEPQIEQGNQATAYEPYSNICPISGYDSASYNRCGINVWDEVTEAGGIDTNTGENITLNNYQRSKNYMKCNPNTLYCVTHMQDYNVRVFWYDTNKEYIENTYVTDLSKVITSPNNAKYFRLQEYGTTYNDNNKICINISNPLYNGNYYPYQGQAVTLTFDNTVYSGVIDWCTGVVTVDRAVVVLDGNNNENWVKSGSYDNAFYLTSITAFDTSKKPLAKTNMYNYIDGALSAQGFTIGTFLNIRDNINGNTDVAGWRTYLSNNNVQFMYYLATPTTIQLTPTQLKTLAGYNTIYTDVGNISIAYQPNNVIAECKEYTDNAIPTVDSELDDTSLNPIANKPVAEAIADIVGDISDIDSNIEGSKQLTTTGNVITVSDSAATYLEELEVEVEPVQDLHGYEYPWVGGAGKNLIPMTIDDIKAINTDGTWSGNTYTILSCTVTIMTDDGSNVTGFKINNAPTSNHANFYLASNITLSSDCVLNGGLGTSTVKLRVYSGTSVAYEDAGYGAKVTAGSYTNVRIVINEGYNANNTIIYPMIRLATVTDATFEPYSNICPISGYDSASLTILDDSTEATAFNDILSGSNGYVDLGTLTWDYSNSRFNATITGMKSDYTYNSDLSNVICSQYHAKDQSATWDNMQSGEFGLYNNTIRIKDNRYTDTTTFTNAMNGVYLIYELATPTTPTITKAQYEMLVNAFGGHAITATFNDTVYSGHVDFTTGVVTVDKAITRRTEFDYKSSSTYNYIYRLGVINKSDITNIANAITDKFKYKNIYAVSESGFYIGTGASGSLQTEIWVGLTLESGVDTLEKANTWLANNGGYVDILYELATPQTIQLTPQQLQMLKGYNTIITDANGGMTVRYQPDNVVGEIKAYASRLYDDIIRRLNELSS